MPLYAPKIARTQRREGGKFLSVKWNVVRGRGYWDDICRAPSRCRVASFLSYATFGLT